LYNKTDRNPKSDVSFPRRSSFVLSQFWTIITHLLPTTTTTTSSKVAFVPSAWWHGVINLQNTVGMAMEGGDLFFSLAPPLTSHGYV
jgi:hypothetical protein